MLANAGRMTAYGRSPAFKQWAKRLGILGLLVEFGLDLEEGDDVGRAAIRTSVSAVGSAIGAFAGGALCTVAAFGTGGGAALGCVVIVGSSSAAVGFLFETTADFILPKRTFTMTKYGGSWDSP